MLNQATLPTARCKMQDVLARATGPLGGVRNGAVCVFEGDMHTPGSLPSVFVIAVAVPFATAGNQEQGCDHVRRGDI
jgi:hypothetical protein